MQRNTCGHISAPFLRESQAGLLSSEKLQARIISDSTNVHTDYVSEYQVERGLLQSPSTQLNSMYCGSGMESDAQTSTDLHGPAQFTADKLRTCRSACALPNLYSSIFYLLGSLLGGMSVVLATGIPTFCLVAANVSPGRPHAH